jgi:hypothetical protein
LLLATAASAQSAGPFAVAEIGRSFYRLDDAVKALGGGDGTITVAPGRYSECAVVTGGNVAIRAATASTAIFDGGACEGKATLVLRGDSATVEGLVFQNVRVADRNGSGIRLEKGDLVVERSTFRNSEQGILTADDAAGVIRISYSTFSGLGGCPDGMCSHSIYVGGYGRLTIDHARFERGTGGHYVKSRAIRTEVTDSSFDDSQGHTTNYMIDLPNGSVGAITGNEFVMGRDKENHSAMITVAAEARANPSAGLSIAGNTASRAPGVTFPTVFVADWSHEPLKIGANTLGSGIRAFEPR